MSEVRLTEARAELLRAARDGELTETQPWNLRKPPYVLWRNDSGTSRVTGPCKALLDGGLLKRGAQTGASLYSSRPIEITVEGERVLTEWESRQSNE